MFNGIEIVVKWVAGSGGPALAAIKERKEAAVERAGPIFLRGCSKTGDGSRRGTGTSRRGEKGSITVVDAELCK